MPVTFCLPNVVNQLINSWVNFLSSDYLDRGISSISDVITICIGLIAVALPISMNVSELVRQRYKSEAFMRVMESLSKVNPQALNKKLFILLLVCVSFKGLLVFEGAEKNVPVVIFLLPFGWFLHALWQTYKHLKITYQLVSNPIEIRDSLVSYCNKSIQSKREKFSIEDGISALMSIETYELVLSHDKNRIDDKIQIMLLKGLDNPDACKLVLAMLDALPMMMASVINVRENSVYKDVTALYLFSLVQIFVKKPLTVDFKQHFIHHFNNNLLLFCEKESKLSDAYWLCNSGQVFRMLAHQELSDEKYKFLLDHFNLLAQATIEQQPAVFPSLIQSVGKFMRYKPGDLPIEVVFSLKISVLHFLAKLWVTAPECVISCRERVNRAGVRTFNEGLTPVPTSIQECLEAFVEPKNFSELFFSWQPIEREIVEVIAVLLIYQISSLIFHSRMVEEDKILNISNIFSNKNIEILRSAYMRINILHSSFLRLLKNESYISKLCLLPPQYALLEKLIEKFIRNLKDDLTEKINIQDCSNA